MKIGERGQVTIPKDIRDRFGLGPDTDVEFHVENGSIVLRKAPKRLEIERWRGRCRASFAGLGYVSVDEFMEDVRGR
jgi:AbrB family looped-hinge helix DNA binding protein